LFALGLFGRSKRFGAATDEQLLAIPEKRLRFGRAPPMSLLICQGLGGELCGFVTPWPSRVNSFRLAMTG
jgi:hypothetical protein